MKPFPWQTILLASLLACALCGCASTDYTPYAGAPVQEGHGGAYKTIDGIDIWSEGTPPRKFQIIGVVTDSRRGGRIAMAGRNRGIAEVAKEHGGQAVLLANDERQFAGMVGNYNSTTSMSGGTANSFGVNSQHAVYRRESKFYILRYL